ncbi:MAG: hypothetical protein MSG64_11075 [Pyrinomonadaceae bacterium MAG19_C2-C3]|nr:hypothetical protein [Pyrinomonadaceae bacterium MAG19_C2-C3]
MVFRHSMLFVTILVTLCLTVPVFAQRQGATNAVSQIWKRVAVHPQAAEQPEVINNTPSYARYLWTLKAWRGALYAGYGDYNLNGVGYRSATVAPTRFAITPYSPVSGKFAVAPAFEFDTEAVSVFRVIGNRLYAPAQDASLPPSLNPLNFAVADESGTWTQHTEQLALHVWDMASIDGIGLFMVTSATCPTTECEDEAVVWQSTDGGVSFFKSLTVRGEFSPSSTTYTRFYFAGVLNRKLYVQGVDDGGALLSRRHHTTSRVFDGTTWTIGGDMLSGGLPDDYGYQPTEFNGELIYMTRYPFSDARRDLVVFDGNEARYLTDIPNGIANFTTDGNYLYVLTPEGDVRRTSDASRAWSRWERLTPFRVFETARPNVSIGRSIAILDGSLYIGTSRAELYRLTARKPLSRRFR